MIKILLIILSFVFLTGCKDDDSQQNNPIQDTVEVSPDDGSINDDQSPLMWGELSCQIKSNCRNPVLNVDYNQLIFLLENEFSVSEFKDGTDDENLMAYFLCGMKWSQTWSDYFPEHQNLELDKFQEVTDFGHQVIDTQRCLLINNYIDAINQYFINTKEYKNEN